MAGVGGLSGAPPISYGPSGPVGGNPGGGILGAPVVGFGPAGASSLTSPATPFSSAPGLAQLDAAASSAPHGQAEPNMLPGWEQNNAGSSTNMMLPGWEGGAIQPSSAPQQLPAGAMNFGAGQVPNQFLDSLHTMFPQHQFTPVDHDPFAQALGSTSSAYA